MGQHRHIGVVADQFRDGAEVFRRAHEADLENLHRQVFQNRAGLLGDGFIIQREVVDDFGGVAGVDAGDHRQHVHAHRRHGGDIGTDAARAAGVVGVKDHDAGRGAVVIALQLGVVLDVDGGWCEGHGDTAKLQSRPFYSLDFGLPNDYHHLDVLDLRLDL